MSERPSPPRWARIASRAIVVGAIASVVVAIVLVEIPAGAPEELRLPRTLVFHAGILAFALPAALIVERLPRNAVGWILAWVALASVLPDVSAGYAAFAIYGPRLPGGQIAAWIFSWTYAVAVGSATTLLFLFFPDGRLPSRRWRPVAWLGVVATLSFGLSYAVLPAPTPIFLTEKPVSLGEGSAALILFSLSTVALLFAAIASAASLFVRARAASQIERQQLKWLALASAAAVVAAVGVLLSGVPLVAGAELMGYVLLGIPIAVGIAVMRYRLYEVDRLISRTLVYGTISLVLLATYVIAVIALQDLLAPVTSGSDIAVAASTLLVIALFQPLRLRAQQIVDRRFYRARYDAARTVEAFMVRLRDEVDIDTVRADLLDVVSATIQPAHAGVWLRRG